MAHNDITKKQELQYKCLHLKSIMKGYYMPGIHGSASHQHEPFRFDAYRNAIRQSNASEVNKPAAQPDTSTASAVAQATQTLATQASQTLAPQVPPPVNTTQAPQGPQVPPQPPLLYLVEIAGPRRIYLINQVQRFR